MFTLPHRYASLKKLLGFTLIELLVVMLILGVLAALVVPRVMGRGDDARVTAARADIAQIKSALKLYYLDNQRYPSTAQGLGALTAKPTTEPLPPAWKQGGYLEKTPADPWGRAYMYLQPGLKGEFDVISYGADGAPGGEGVNADISE